MAEALRPDHAVREIASIPLDQPLEARLTEAAQALSAYLARMGALAGALYASGHGRRSREGRAERPPANAREESLAVTRAAVADLFEPGDSLRLPAEDAAAIFLGLIFTRRRPDETGRLNAERLVDAFLHGTLTTEGEEA